MTGPGVVTIRRQVLDVDLRGTEVEGLALQRRLPRLCADVLTPTIEAALGAIDPGDAFLSFDRLAIDLTVSSLEGLDAELADAVRREFEEHFRRHPVPRPGSTGATGELDTMDAGEQRTPAETVDDALVTFLRTGRLPWAFVLPQGTTLAEFILGRWLDLGGQPVPPPAARQRLLAVLASPEARARLMMQFTPAFVMTVLHGLSPEMAASVQQVEAALGNLTSGSPASRAFSRAVRAVALRAAAANRRVPPAELVRAAWMTLDAAHPTDRPLAAVLERAWPGSLRVAGPPDPVLVPEPDHSRPTTAAAGAVEAAGLLVENAGLVLLHPFLPRFFAGLGVAVGDELANPDRAVCLLHHLVTGDLTAPEHQLTLTKALCGVPLDVPTEADVGLAAEETAEATALLEAAIGHWQALRGTSPDVLRLEFLQRPGVLSVTGDGDWLLRVEDRSIDILLDQLPWGYSSFRLPWMSRLMMVEWR